MSEVSNPTPTTPALPKKNHVWIYFFVFVFTASVGVAVFMIWYNRSIKLKPEQLEEARKLWQETGPKSYDMVYKKRLNKEEQFTTFAVKVRQGKVEEVRMNGKQLEREKEEDQDPRPYHSMHAQFLYLTRFMDLDQKPNAPKVYFVAEFDSQTGAILHYTRSDSHTNQRVEMIFTLKAVE